MLTLSSVYKPTITIDDEPVMLHVKRLTRQEAIEFSTKFTDYAQPRGDTARTPEQEAAREAEVRSFVEDSIARYVSVAPGQVQDDERTLLTGDDIIRVFCGRRDVLMACYQAIYAENMMGKAEKNALRSLSVFAPGSRPSTPVPPGDAPASIATNAEPNGSASDAPATVSNDSTDAGNPSASGAITKVH